MDDRSQVQLLGGQQRETDTKIESHLMAKHTENAGPCTIRFADTVIDDALQQVEQSRSLEAIVEFRERAAAAEAQEDWRTAADAYDAILKLDPAIRFAQDQAPRHMAKSTAVLISDGNLYMIYASVLSGLELSTDTPNIKVKENHRISNRSGSWQGGKKKLFPAPNELNIFSFLHRLR